MTKKNKVIGIGFHKTGTSTLRSVLTELGYEVLGARPDLASNLFNQEFEEVITLTESYDAFQDNPWPLLYKELDKRYPNSKFILTLRNEEKWIKSSVNYFGTRDTEMRRWIYGMGHPQGYENLYLEKYKNHNREVIAYFSKRKNDLLIIDWEKNIGWQELCEFLDEPIPNKPLPHVNKGDYSEKNKPASLIFNKALKRFLGKTDKG